jgi:hypothetical protein
MSAPSLRSLFSSILLGHLGVAAALSGCIIVADTDEPDSPSGSAGSGAGSAGKGGSAGASGTGGAGSGGAGGAGSGGAGAGGAGSGGVGGSGGFGGYTTISTEGFDAFACTNLTPGALAALKVDSVELWQSLTFTPPASPLETEGATCAGATNQTACLAAVEAAHGEPWDGTLSIRVVGPPGSAAERLVTTKGDAVTLIDDYPTLKANLLPVDALEKLRFVARYATNGFRCEHVRRTDEGFELVGQATLSDCPITTQRQLVRVAAGGDVTVLAGEVPVGSGACAGRRPAGLGEQAVASAGALTRYLERQAYLEAASVEAFARLADELASFGAPSELVERARRAGDDEVRHHALLLALGRRFDPGFACSAPDVAPAKVRSLFDLALENAVEGCVRETWGALLAHHQAARATDGSVRFACALIADDETRHAELSWATHRWLLGLLGEGERRAIDEAMARAADELFAELAAGDEFGEGERASLGLPSADEACALLERLDASLWATPLAA